MISSEWILFVVFILAVDLPNPKIEPRSPALQADSYCQSHEESPYSGVCVRVHAHAHTCVVFVAIHGLSLVAVSRSYSYLLAS